MLSATLDEAAAVGRAMRPWELSVPGLTEALGSSTPVLAALSRFTDVQSARVDAVESRIGACVIGAKTALDHYRDADFDMAAAHRKAARRAGAVSPEGG